jgi:hypothetical protein
MHNLRAIVGGSVDTEIEKGKWLVNAWIKLCFT